jgi:hypothetical protein
MLGQLTQCRTPQPDRSAEADRVRPGDRRVETLGEISPSSTGGGGKVMGQFDFQEERGDARCSRPRSTTRTRISRRRGRVLREDRPDPHPRQGRQDGGRAGRQDIPQLFGGGEIKDEGKSAPGGMPGHGGPTRPPGMKPGPRPGAPGGGGATVTPKTPAPGGATPAKPGATPAKPATGAAAKPGSGSTTTPAGGKPPASKPAGSPSSPSKGNK